MTEKNFPVIDLEATGRNIMRLRKDRGLSVREVQDFFSLDSPRAVYLWQKGKNLPTVDNLYALSVLLEVPMNEILVPMVPVGTVQKNEQQAEACCSGFLPAVRDTAEAGALRPILPVPVRGFQRAGDRNRRFQ